MVAVLSRETGRKVVERNSLSVQHCTCPNGHDFLEYKWCLILFSPRSKSPEGDVVSLIGRASIDRGTLTHPWLNWRLAVRQGGNPNPP